MSLAPSSVWEAPIFISRPYVSIHHTSHFLSNSSSRNHLKGKHWPGESSPSWWYQVDANLDIIGTCHKTYCSQQNSHHSHAQPSSRLEASPPTLGLCGHKHLPPFRIPTKLSSRKSLPEIWKLLRQNVFLYPLS